MDPSLPLLGTPSRVISARLFPKSAGPLPRVSAGRADCDTVLYWDDLEPADFYKPEVHQFSRLHPRRRRHFRSRPSNLRDDRFADGF